ncbi:transcriptional regulator [Xanthomonas nasturtii]|uniref:helix-turn-helix transcriptional regulator n=1 Tax=Xanthomonas TaxID=338 RepID=UPI0007E3FCAF|nr:MULTISPECIES: AlpA family phage regulatory protein [Xanthomonas]OAX87930.1 transcriptional regulator [Xanthomonas nasturtii]UXA52313.1 AlpA family phage regulatory protein [Xanthomonas prunicola]WVL57740.1 AlpA family phage regulatory protein [Xanthomonas nasturtii]
MNLRYNRSTHTNHSQNTETGGVVPPATRSKRVIRKKDLAKKLSCSESTIDNRLNPSSRWYDETFPRPVPLGAGGSRSSAKGWIEYVVDEWLESRI